MSWLDIYCRLSGKELPPATNQRRSPKSDAIWSTEGEGRKPNLGGKRLSVTSVRGGPASSRQRQGEHQHQAKHLAPLIQSHLHNNLFPWYTLKIELGRPQDVSNKEDQSVPIIVDNLFSVIVQIWRSGECSKFKFRIICFFSCIRIWENFANPIFRACLPVYSGNARSCSIAKFQHQQSHIDVSMAYFYLFPCIGSTPSKERGQGGDFIQCTVNK